MASTVASHVDDEMTSKLQSVSSETGHSRSRVIASAVRMFLTLTPRGREAVDRVVQGGNALEREFMAKFVSRAAIRAREQIVDARFASMPVEVTGNTRLESDEQIEAEAVRMCR